MSLDVYLEDDAGNEIYSANITHNLNEMAMHCGFYDSMWRPDEHGLTTAKQVADAMRPGIAMLATNRIDCERFNSPNGWGMYENFLPFCLNYLHACDSNPDAIVRISR